jgi:hypothetical protein
MVKDLYNALKPFEGQKVYTGKGWSAKIGDLNNTKKMQLGINFFYISGYVKGGFNSDVDVSFQACLNGGKDYEENNGHYSKTCIYYSFLSHIGKIDNDGKLTLKEWEQIEEGLKFTPADPNKIKQQIRSAEIKEDELREAQSLIPSFFKS